MTVSQNTALLGALLGTTTGLNFFDKRVFGGLHSINIGVIFKGCSFGMNSAPWSIHLGCKYILPPKAQMHRILTGANFALSEFQSDINEKIFKNSAVANAIFIGCNFNGEPITKNLLAKLGAINSDQAICNIDDLKERIEKFPLVRAIANLQAIEELLNSMDE